MVPFGSSPGAEGGANRLVAEALTADLQLRIVEALSDQALGYLLGSDGPTPVIPVPTPSTTPSTISFDHLLDHPVKFGISPPPSGPSALRPRRFRSYG
jgi:hypothetical protein